MSVKELTELSLTDFGKEYQSVGEEVECYLS